MAGRAARLPGVYAAVAPTGPDWTRAGTALVAVLPGQESSGPAGQAVISTVEHALVGSPGVLGVGGDGASLIDFDHAVYGRFPLMLTLIGLATFILLARAFRSVLLAAKAVVFNLISLSAAYGVLTWVFQDGHGSTPMFGVRPPARSRCGCRSWYSRSSSACRWTMRCSSCRRIREEYDASGDARQAVVTGLGRTGRLVTGAAAILMLSFVSLSTGPMTDLKILATGLGAGILVDAVGRPLPARPGDGRAAGPGELVAAGLARPGPARARLPRCPRPRAGRCGRHAVTDEPAE